VANSQATDFRLRNPPNINIATHQPYSCQIPKTVVACSLFSLGRAIQLSIHYKQVLLLVSHCIMKVLLILTMPQICFRLQQIELISSSLRNLRHRRLQVFLRCHVSRVLGYHQLARCSSRLLVSFGSFTIFLTLEGSSA